MPPYREARRKENRLCGGIPRDSDHRSYIYRETRAGPIRQGIRCSTLARIKSLIYSVIIIRVSASASVIVDYRRIVEAR